MQAGYVPGAEEQSLTYPAVLASRRKAEGVNIFSLPALLPGHSRMGQSPLHIWMSLSTLTT